MLLMLLLWPGAAPAVGPAPAASVAVFRLEAKLGVPAGAADLLTETLLSEVRRSGAFARVVSPAEISLLMRPEQQQFLLRCATDECALVDNELAGALGVSHILVGNLGKLGNSYLLNLRLLDVRSSVLLASLSERARGHTEEALLDLVRPAVVRLLQDGGMAPAPTPAPAASSADGTRRRILWGVAGGWAAVAVSVGAASVVGVGAALAVAGVDLALGGRPGGVHRVTATQAALANGVFAGGLLAGGASLAAALCALVIVVVAGVAA